MSEPVKTVMARDVLSRMKKVTAGNGYLSELGRRNGQFVSRRIRVLSTMQDGEFPGVAVLMGKGSPDAAAQLGKFRDDAHIGLLFYGKATDLPSELERLEADGKRALLSGPRLEGAHGDVRYVDTVPFYSEQEQVDRGLVLVTFACPYNWTADAP